MTPYERSRKALEGVNVRQVLEASNLPVEIATAIADALEAAKPEGRLAKWEQFEDYMPPDGCVFIPPEKAHLPIILNDKDGNYWIRDPLPLPEVATSGAQGMSEDVNVLLGRLTDASIDLAHLCKRYEKALRRIARWHGEFPETGKTWDDGSPMSYGAAYGSNGERDYMRQVALSALNDSHAADQRSHDKEASHE